MVGQILQEKDPLILSGATDIGLWVTKKHMEIDHFLYLGDVKELNLLNENQKGFEIGLLYLMNLQCKSWVTF